MMEPLTTSVATGSAAAGASTAAGASASAAGGASVAAASQQAETARRLASALFVKPAELQAVRDSEIVDEFASPIYAGLAAAPAGPTVAVSTPDVFAPYKGDARPEILGPAGSVPDVVDNPTPRLPVALGDGSHPPVLSPSLKEFSEWLHVAPTIREQLDAGERRIVVERIVLDTKIAENGDHRSAVCLIKERVVDRKFLEHGHLTDLISEIKHGNVPTIRQLYLAVIDLVDLATFKVFQPLLLRVEPATYRLRQISADLDYKKVRSPKPKQEKTKVKIDRRVEDRGWFKPDHVVEKIGHVDREMVKQLDITELDIKDIQTIEYTKEQLDALLSQRAELDGLFGDAAALVRLENLLSPEAIADINGKVVAWVRENVVTTTSRYTTTEEFHRAFGMDLGRLLGKRIKESDRHVRVEEKSTVSEYLSPSDTINLEKINTYRKAINVFASQQKTATVEFNPKVLDSYVAPGNGTTFKGGWLSYVPGGSLVNLATKSDLGCKLTGWDVFWAGVDVATLALAFVTLGGSTMVQAAKGGAKAGAKGAAKGMATKASKAAVKSSAKSGVRQSGAIQIKNAGKAGAKAKPAIGISRPEITYKNIPGMDGKWIGTPGNSTWMPNPKSVPKNIFANPYGKPFRQILRENRMPKGIPFLDGYPDFRQGLKAIVRIEKMGVNRLRNFGRADSLLARQVRNGKASPNIARYLKQMGVNLKKTTKGDISRMRKLFGLSWHEHQNKHFMQLLSQELHGTIPHRGGISVLKEESRTIAKLAEPTARNTVQSTFSTAPRSATMVGTVTMEQ